MPDIEINIGDRKFFVTCRAGEEHFLNAAAKMLDSEATPLQAQMGRLPEARMLLMAGLMLADRTASVEDELRQARELITELQGRPAVEKPVAVMPREVGETLAELAARAESLASSIEERLS
ncbi:MAG: cell division protein ZapA [Cypionkella sp.]